MFSTAESMAIQLAAHCDLAPPVKLKEELLQCCEVKTRSTKVGYLMYLGNSNGLLLVLILSCCEEELMLLV